MKLKEEIDDIITNAHSYGELETSNEELTDDIIKAIDNRINEKLQHVNEVLNDSRLTIQGCQRLKGKKDAFEEVMEMLKS